MPGPAFRFVHASDFHLDQPLSGVEEVPDQLREMFCDAPYLAAERVFDTALAEQADFVLLCGDIVNLKNAGARPLDFLFEQFQRMREEAVTVYWCDSGHDNLEYWPSAVPLPPNVQLFSHESVDVVTHRREGKVLATILGSAGNKSGRIRAEEFDNGAAGYVIAMTHGEIVVLDQDSGQIHPVFRFLGAKIQPLVPQDVQWIVYIRGEQGEVTNGFATTDWYMTILNPDGAFGEGGAAGTKLATTEEGKDPSRTIRASLDRYFRSLE